MKRTIIALVSVLLVFIITTVIMSFTVINSSNYLKNFNIISVNNINTKYNIKFEKVKAAKEYEIVVYNSDDSVFYKKNLKNNNALISLDNIVYNNKYKLLIYAYDNNGNSICVNNPYYFTYGEPTFSEENSLVLDSKNDYILKINGDLKKKDYYLAILDGNYIINKEKVKDNEYTISKKYYSGLKQVIKVNLYDNDNVINSINLYSNMSPISDIKINNPKNNSEVSYEDINLDFEGGDNATSYKLEIYNEDKLLKNITVNSKNLIISSDFFKRGQNYKVVVNGLYNDKKEYTKTATVSFKISSKDTLRPPYVNINTNNVKKNDLIELFNPNKSGKIYYTIDGTEPNDKSILYNDKIAVKENMIIKAIVKDKNKNDSAISEFKLNVTDKSKYTIYISSNKDVNEIESIINKITKNLTQKEVSVIQNEENESVNTRISNAKNKNADLYLAFYSKQQNEDNRELSIWIKDKLCYSYSISNLLLNDLSKIYDGDIKQIQFIGKSLEELNKNQVSNNLVINLGNIDNDEDQKWLIDKKDLIADTIANTILKYFGLI